VVAGPEMSAGQVMKATAQRLGARRSAQER
jgi:hypothetical protein